MRPLWHQMAARKPRRALCFLVLNILISFQRATRLQVLCKLFWLATWVIKWWCKKAGRLKASTCQPPSYKPCLRKRANSFGQQVFKNFDKPLTFPRMAWCESSKTSMVQLQPRATFGRTLMFLWNHWVLTALLVILAFGCGAFLQIPKLFLLMIQKMLNPSNGRPLDLWRVMWMIFIELEICKMRDGWRFAPPLTRCTSGGNSKRMSTDMLARIFQWPLIRTMVAVWLWINHTTSRCLRMCRSILSVFLWHPHLWLRRRSQLVVLRLVPCNGSLCRRNH